MDEVEARAHATRLRRQWMGFLSYLMFLVPMIYAEQQGWLALGYQGFILFVAVALLVNLLFFLAIRSRYSARFADPSLMVPQIAVAILLALVMGYYLDERARTLTILLLLAACFFGIFKLARREYLVLTGVAIVGYAVMLRLKYSAGSPAGQDTSLALLNLSILVMILVWMALLGSYVAGLRIRLASARGRLQELASRDELTGLYNRRHLMDTLDQQQERSKRYSEPFTLCILDLDHFKLINDQHGHSAGDEVLRGFAERVRSQLRKMDIIGRGEVDSTFGRYGGEEFLLLLPYAAGSSAASCMARLRKAVADAPFPTSVGNMTVTFSAGVAQHKPGESNASLIARADAALYRAKTSGRDRMQDADEPEPGGAAPDARQE